MLSPSTADDNIGDKLFACKKIDTVTVVVLVDLQVQRIELHERITPTEWHHHILPPSSGVTLRDPALTLTFAEVFAID